MLAPHKIAEISVHYHTVLYCIIKEGVGDGSIHAFEDLS
jgi:hypothetical protein